MYSPHARTRTALTVALCSASGETVARVYNAGLCSDNHSHPLTTDLVWNAFYLHALLLDSDHQPTLPPLRLPHHGKQSDRLDEALVARNKRMVGGAYQPYWAHACDECEKIIPLRPSSHRAYPERLSACVMDGVTIGHPRCNVDHCRNDLGSPRHRFCHAHRQLEGMCAIKQCPHAVSDNMRTCNTPAHRAHELEKRERGRAIHRLKKRLAGHSTAEESQAATADECVDKTASRAFKTALTRRYTHNEQLIVRCCGVIVSRATFYEAESVSNCLAFLLRTFPPELPRCQPSFCFFDNNCQLLKHIRASGETRLSNVGLPVDVFHATVKHKDSDAYCAMNCNPASFPELMQGKEWLFNSSIAEQTNGWFGKFLPIVREMTKIHHNFFLDEMIMIYNEWKVSTLAQRGAKPRIVPYDELRLPRS
ncbi:hypothetical protein C8Q76DRAFT_817301 [Earliella scabrosa]|nr:hypothetical protein C8Q76DRAFT_817301 [Earliella scabrosa]